MPIGRRLYRLTVSQDLPTLYNAVVSPHTDVLNCLGKHIPDLGQHNTLASAQHQLQMPDESRGVSDLPIRPTWRRWFGDFQQSVEALALRDIDLLVADKAELKSTALALFGRLRSELRIGGRNQGGGRRQAFPPQSLSLT